MGYLSKLFMTASLITATALYNTGSLEARISTPSNKIPNHIIFPEKKQNKPVNFMWIEEAQNAFRGGVDCFKKGEYECALENFIDLKKIYGNVNYDIEKDKSILQYFLGETKYNMGINKSDEKLLKDSLDHFNLSENHINIFLKKDKMKESDKVNLNTHLNLLHIGLTKANAILGNTFTALAYAFKASEYGSINEFKGLTAYILSNALPKEYQELTNKMQLWDDILVRDIATNLNRMGIRCDKFGEYKCAEENFRKSLDLFKEKRDSTGDLWIHLVEKNLGLTLYNQGIWEGDLIPIKQSIAHFKNAKDEILHFDKNHIDYNYSLHNMNLNMSLFELNMNLSLASITSGDANKSLDFAIESYQFANNDKARLRTSNFISQIITSVSIEKRDRIMNEIKETVNPIIIEDMTKLINSYRTFNHKPF